MHCIQRCIAFKEALVRNDNKNDKLKVKQIVKDKYVKSILKDYAYKHQPPKKRILYTLIDKGLWRSVLFVTNLKLKSGM